MTKIVTFDDIANFIDSQPDEKLVNFDEVDFNSECGCIMVQYGKSIGLDFDRCYTRKFVKIGNRINTVSELEPGIVFTDFWPASGGGSKKSTHTYKELKQHVAEKRRKRSQQSLSGQS